MSSGPDEALAAHELDLVSRAAKGDTAAFDRFFERNAPAVQLLAERLLGPGDVADGVVVEAFEKTVRRLPLLGARNSSPALYVLSTARNGAYAALGRGRPAADGGPLAALLALPSRQRELLALRELGLPEAECAEVAGIDPSDVGPQVARARLRLTDELEGLSLSTVFADDRAERLLAAEVVRVEGQPVTGALAQEISTHADEDSRFAAALSAVRSPSRSVGQLPAVSGPARLAATARGKAVVGGGAGAAGAIGSASTASATPASAPPVASGPPAVPRTKSDPYDAEIGDEVAWGIVDDEDGFSDGGQAPGKPAVDRPTDGQWADGAGALSEEPTRLSPASPATGSVPIPPVAPGAGGPGDGSLADPFAGWDDALDWDEDEKEWAAGPGAGAASAPQPPAAPDLEKHDSTVPSRAAEPNPIAAAAAGGSIAPHEPVVVDLGETRAFDAVAAGLVDPDPIPVSDFDHGDEPPAGRRSPWRWLAWVIAFLVLFAGVAFATYTYVEANRDSDEPPASRLDDTTPAAKSSPTPKPSRTPTAKKSTSSSKSSSSGTTGGSGSTSSSSSGSGSGSSSGSTGSSGSSASSGRSSSGSGTSSGGSSTKSTGGGTSTTKKDDAGQVTSGESTSGGSVRGGNGGNGGTAGGTTP